MYIRTILLSLVFCIFNACDSLKGNNLQQIKITIDSHPLIVEVVANEKDRNRGLMFRTDLESNSGMIFVWPNVEYRNFWMKNTLIPLDIAFFDEQNFLINSLTMKPDNNTGDYGDYKSAEPAKYAIEVNAGWFRKHNIKKYAILKIPHKLVADN